MVGAVLPAYCTMFGPLAGFQVLDLTDGVAGLRRSANLVG
jgi:hypothetical protein